MNNEKKSESTTSQSVSTERPRPKPIGTITSSTLHERKPNKGGEKK